MGEKKKHGGESHHRSGEVEGLGLVFWVKQRTEVQMLTDLH